MTRHLAWPAFPRTAPWSGGRAVSICVLAGWYLRLRDTLPAGKTVFNLISKILAEDEIQEPVFSIGMNAIGP